MLSGSNHLPANKLRLSLLRQNNGFMGSGPFREHFFGAASLQQVGGFYVREGLKYSATTIGLRKRLSFRRRRATRSGGPRSPARG